MYVYRRTQNLIKNIISNKKKIPKQLYTSRIPTDDSFLFWLIYKVALIIIKTGKLNELIYKQHVHVYVPELYICT